MVKVTQVENGEFLRNLAQLIQPHTADIEDEFTDFLLSPQAVRHISVVGGWSGGESGQSEFRVDDLTGIPPGKYSLAYEIDHTGKILSNGYSVAVAINETAKGKELSVIPPSKK